MKYSNYSAVIIGSGIAGLYAALKIDQQVNLPDGLLLITKSKLGESNSMYAQGGMVAVMKENKADSTASHISDTIKAGAGLSEFNTVKYISEHSDAVVKDLLKFGVEFDRDENNNLIESWISSSKEAHRIENIKDGLYTLTEVAAPEGYVVAGNKNTWTINPSSGWKSDCMIIDNISASKYVDKGINNILNTGKKEDIDGQYFVLKLRESYENRLNNKDFLEYEGELPKYILLKGSYLEAIGVLFNSNSVQYEFFGTEENLSSQINSATDISFFYDNDGIYYTRIWRTDTNVVRGFITNDNLYIVPLSDLTKEELEELSLSNDINTVEKAKTRTLTR